MFNNYFKSRKIAVGIDIGTYLVKVVVTEAHKDGSGELPKIIGVGVAESKGLRHGYIIHSHDAVRSIRKAISEAEKSSGIKIKEAFLAIGGVGLSGYISHGSNITGRADMEISKIDIANAIEVSRIELPPSASLNRTILHTIPIKYKIDGKQVLGRPDEMKGNKLEVKTLFITCLEHHFNDLILAVEEAGVSVLNVIAAPISAGVVTLSKTQKIAGCVLANIGSETVSIVVYENNMPISLEVFPIGSNDITNDIALGLRIPIDEAEQLKLGSLIGGNFPKKKLDEIIYARVSDIFELIDSHLKKIGKSGLLPAGIVLTGGGSGVTTIEDLAKAYLKLPSKVAYMAHDGGKVQIKDSMWAVAYGLCVIGLIDESEKPIEIRMGNRMVKVVKNSLLEWLKKLGKQLIP